MPYLDIGASTWDDRDISTQSPSMQSQVSLAPKTFAVWFAALFVLSQWPLYAVQHVGIQDFVNHAARLHVLLHLGGDPLLQRYYTLTPGLAPNLPIETVGLLLAKLFGVDTGLKLFASLSSLMLTSGCVTLGRALSKQLHPLALGALLFANSLFFFYGLFNYIFGLGLALWLLAAWVATRGSWQQLLAFALGASILYLCHLAALGIYAIGVACALLIEWRTNKTSPWEKAREAAFAAMQFVPAAIMHLWLYVPPIKEFAEANRIDIASLVLRKLILLAKTPTAIFSAHPLVGFVVFFAALLLLHRAWRGRLLSFAPLALWSATTLLLLMFILPDRAFGSGMLDARLMLPIGLLLWSGVRFERAPDARWRFLMLLAIATCVVAISVEEYYRWRSLEAPQAELRSALRQLPAGSRIATVYLPGDNGSVQARISEHSAGWAIIDRSALVSSLYARPFQPVWIGYTSDAEQRARLARFDDPAASAAAMATLLPAFDYIVVFGSTANRVAYGAGASVVYAANSVHIFKP